MQAVLLAPKQTVLSECFVANHGEQVRPYCVEMLPLRITSPQRANSFSSQTL